MELVKELFFKRPIKCFIQKPKLYCLGFCIASAPCRKSTLLFAMVPISMNSLTIGTPKEQGNNWIKEKEKNERGTLWIRLN